MLKPSHPTDRFARRCPCSPLRLGFRRWHGQDSDDYRCRLRSFLTARRKEMNCKLKINSNGKQHPISIDKGTWVALLV